MPILGKKFNGETITVLARSDFKEMIYDKEYYWYYIKFDDQYGWMYGQFITGLKEESQYRVFQYNSSRDKTIYDFDFEKRKFINLIDNQSITSSYNKTEYDYGYDKACWFDTIEIRDNDGHNGTSNLIIENKEGKKITLFGDDTGYYYGECAFLKLSNNEKYFVVDQGTSFVRYIGIYNSNTGQKVASGSYVDEIEYNGRESIYYFHSGKVIRDDKQAAIDYITENSIKDINGNGIEDIELQNRINNAPGYSSFNFGTLYEFNTETGETEEKGFILYYIDIQ